MTRGTDHEQVRPVWPGALVTGGAQGLGEGMAAALTRPGRRVMIGDVLEDAAADRGQLRRRAVRPARRHRRRRVGGRGRAHRGRLGGLDVLVNNAGIEITQLLADLDADAVRTMLEVNVLGTPSASSTACARCARAARRAGRRIINVASVAATIAFPASRATRPRSPAVDRLTRVRRWSRASSATACASTASTPAGADGDGRRAGPRRRALGLFAARRRPSTASSG